MAQLGKMDRVVELIQAQVATLDSMALVPTKLEEYPKGRALHDIDFPACLTVPGPATHEFRTSGPDIQEYREYFVRVYVATTGKGLDGEVLYDITTLIDEVVEVLLFATGELWDTGPAEGIYVNYDQRPRDTGYVPDLDWYNEIYQGFEVVLSVRRKLN